MGFPIRKSPGQRLFASSPEHIGGYTVLHRLCMPRHPPYTLSSLTTLIKDRLDITPCEVIPSQFAQVLQATE